MTSDRRKDEAAEVPDDGAGPHESAGSDHRAGSDRNGPTYPLPRSVCCPFCHESDTELQSPFGGVMSVAQYYCRRCRTVFDWIKWGNE